MGAASSSIRNATSPASASLWIFSKVPSSFGNYLSTMEARGTGDVPMPLLAFVPARIGLGMRSQQLSPELFKRWRLGARGDYGAMPVPVPVPDSTVLIPGG